MAGAAANKKTQEIGKGKPGPGRPKGALNKTTLVAKEAIATAAEQLGGTERLVAWAQENSKNEHAFWSSIYPKLLPLQVGGDPDAPLVHRIVREFVRP